MPDTIAPVCPKCGSDDTSIKSTDYFSCAKCRTAWTEYGWTKRVETLQDNTLPVGTLLEHPVHGVAEFGGVSSLGLSGKQPKDYLLLNYKEPQKIYIPLERAGLLKIVKNRHVGCWKEYTKSVSA